MAAAGGFMIGAAIFGIVSGGIGIGSAALFSYTYADQAIKTKDAPFTSTIRIAVGLDSQGGLSSAGGDLPDARNFNKFGDFIGMVADPGKTMDSGTSQDFTIKQSTGQQAHYTLFSANDDAICVAYAYMIWAGEGPDTQYGMVGDFGHVCGATWFYSGMTIPGTNHTPDCFWVDANGDQPTTGFQVNWVDMRGDPSRNGQPADTFCDSPSFKTYTIADPNSIDYWVSQKPRIRSSSVATTSGPPRAERTSKKQRRSFAEKFSDVLIMDDLAEHSAHRLCNSTTSSGPDFLNPQEGLFCDMRRKSIYPVCKSNTATMAGNGTSTSCFDAEAMSLRGPGLRRRTTPYVVQDWTKQRVEHQKRDGMERSLEA